VCGRTPYARQPAAENGPCGGSDRREAGPRVNRLTAAFLIEGCTDNRQEMRGGKTTQALWERHHWSRNYSVPPRREMISKQARVT